MSDTPHYPLFCTVDISSEDVSEVLQAANREEQKSSKLRNAWVLVQRRDQTIFPIPTTTVSRVETEFKDAQVSELGAFCRTRFERTGLISNEDFGIIDKRSLIDQTVLIVRWEMYTPEDDAMLRIIWGDAAPVEQAKIKGIIKTPEDEALLRKIQGKATMHDEVLLQRVREDTLRDDRPSHDGVSRARKDPEQTQGRARSDSNMARERVKQKTEELNNTHTFPITGASLVATRTGTPHPRTTRARTPNLSMRSPTAASLKRWSKGVEVNEKHANLDSPTHDGEEDGEVMEGWRMMRVPIESAMRDTNLIIRRSITDLLKIRGLFDRYGVLRY